MTKILRDAESVSRRILILGLTDLTLNPTLNQTKPVGKNKEVDEISCYVLLTRVYLKKI